MIGAIWADLLLLLGIAVVAVLVMALLAPLEALGWYAGWRQRRRYTLSGAEGAAGAAAAGAARPPEAAHYVVFLSGIGAPSGRWHYPEEMEFLRRLREALPGAAVIDDLFAYSVTADAIGATARGQRLARMWESLERTVRSNQGAPIGALINLRNLFQVTVSVDHRYGPFFNLGQAENVRDALLAHGYRSERRAGVVLIGYSGGAQVSLGAAAYLRPLLGAPVTVISVGGVMSSEPSCLQVEHLYHLWGSKDLTQTLGDLAFFGRWPVATGSPWNRARRLGKITRLAMGPVAHNGAAGYFGPAPLPDGRARIDQTLDTVVRLVTGDAPPVPHSPRAGGPVRTSLPEGAPAGPEAPLAAAPPGTPES